MRPHTVLKKACPLLFIPVLTIAMTAQPVYRYPDISPALLRDANSVVRNKETVFEITGIGNAVQRIKYAVTILNRNGLKYSVFIQPYNKFQTVRNIKWNIYDQNGSLVKNKSNTSVEDYSAIAGYELFSDSRVKFIDPKYRNTPFTVEYSYEIVYDGLLSYPVWRVYEDYYMSVEKSSFVIITPEGFRFRYAGKNMPSEGSVTSFRNTTTYLWTVSNQPAVKEESYCAPLQTYTPVIYTAPDDFEIDNHTGNCETWEAFGDWIDRLAAGRDVLEQKSAEKLKGILQGADSDYEKIERLYSYMQNKVRYVSLQIGIGGWQTIDASTVDRLSYGDCKALANYMKTLLGLAGIKSYYTLACAGENAPAILNDFPSNQFNHVLLCVPLMKDTIWLECTDQHIAAGYIGKFTDDREVLLTEQGGGRLVRTKSYSLEENLQDRKGSLDIGNDGSVNSVVTTSYNGLFYTDNYKIFFMDDADKKLFIVDKIKTPFINLFDYKYSEKRSAIPAIDETIKFSITDFCTRMENRFLFNPNLMTRFSKVPVKTKDRKSEIVIRRPYWESDTLAYVLPSLYKVGNIPLNLVLQSKFGEYQTKIVYNDHELRHIRTLKFFRGEYPASDFDEFEDFCRKVAISDERKVTLVNGEVIPK